MVEELFPASVSLVSEVDVYEGIVPGPDGFFDELHAGVPGGSSAFSDVAGGAGADYVFPVCLSANAAGDDVVEGQFAGGEAFAAILAFVFVAGEDVPAVELYLVAGQAVVEQQADDSGYGDVEIYGGDPVMSIRLEVMSEPADLAPALEVVVGISTLLERDDFGNVSKQQREGPLGPDYADRHIVLVQDKHVTGQS